MSKLQALKDIEKKLSGYMAGTREGKSTESGLRRRSAEQESFGIDAGMEARGESDHAKRRALEHKYRHHDFLSEHLHNMANDMKQAKALIKAHGNDKHLGNSSLGKAIEHVKKNHKE